LRFFAGREHKLPVDQNMLMAMVAPRGLLMASAYSESQGAPFGFEQSFRSVESVYRFLGAESKIGLSLRAGEHATTAEDIERYVDFFDTVFGRGTAPVPRDLMMPVAPKLRDGRIPSRTAGVRERIEWLLGERPPDVTFPVSEMLTKRPMTSDGWLAGLYERPLDVKGARAVAMPFGDDLKGDLYLPDPLPAKSVPVVIWLHPYAHSTGYSRYARPTIAELTHGGFAVLAFDQIGYGSRIHQATRFYERYPKWSLLGKMVDDTRAAVSAVAALEIIDSGRVYLAGYSLGGKVALFTAALDERVAGVIAASAFTPWRSPSPDTEGIQHYTDLHALLPRLAQFKGNEREIPVDYDEIIGAIAPRPVYLRAPQLDRYASRDDVRRAVESARAAWKSRGASDRLTLVTPVDFNRFRLEAQQEAFHWLSGLQ
jgi:pimeloyl-ACP methyl ester carboxylesterase